MFWYVIHRGNINEASNTEGAVDDETTSFTCCISNFELQQVVDCRYKCVQVTEEVTYPCAHWAWQYCFVSTSYWFDNSFVSNVVKFINAAVESFNWVFVCLGGTTT